MKGKWASGIAPRNFAWIIKDRLAISERPGGYARAHRPVRRQEEIIWIREQGFARVVSLLTSPHNLHAYDELGVSWEHIPLPLHEDPAGRCWPSCTPSWPSGWPRRRRSSLHQEELSDRLQGVVAGYLVWSGMVPSSAHAISIVEQINSRQMGPPGPGAGGHRPDDGEVEVLSRSWR